MSNLTAKIVFRDGKNHAPPGGRLWGEVIVTCSKPVKLSKVFMDFRVNSYGRMWGSTIRLNGQELNPGTHAIPFGFNLPILNYPSDHALELRAKVCETGLFGGSVTTQAPIEMYHP